MKTTQKLISIFITFLLCLSISTVSAFSATTDTGSRLLRVAIPVSASNADLEMAYVEYITEYLHEIAQYTGWSYEIIKVPGTYQDGLQDTLQMLQDGTADLAVPLGYVEGMEGEIYFTQNSVLTASTVLQIPNSVYEGFQLGSEVRVAALKGNGMEEAANDFFSKNNVSPQYLRFASVVEQMEAVRSGKADVMLNSDLEYIPNMSIVAEFSPVSLYFATNDQALLHDLDQALLFIKQANPSFANDLYEKYMSSNNQELTLEETDFIETADPFVVAVLDHNEPYQYMDEETGEYCGIGVDLLRFISQKVGLKFEFIAVENWEELSQLIRENKVQIIAQMPCDYTFAAERDLTITSSYVSSPYMLTAEAGFQGPVSGQRLAVMEVSTYTEGKYVGDTIPYANMGECIEAIRTNEADYTYLDLYTAQYYLGDSRYSSFGMIPQSYTPRSVCFGLTKPTDHELLSILNKSIAQISDAELQNIITQNVYPDREIGLLDIIVAHPLRALALFGSISCFIAGMLLFLLWRKDRLSKALRKTAMEDGLTHLYHASACRKLVTHKLSQIKQDQLGAFLVIDLDDFKQINDKYGHQKGDWVLQQFAQVLCEMLKNDSLVSRIGGDEFVIFFESIQRKEDLSSICEKIRTAAHTILLDNSPVTVSIGATFVRSGIHYDDLYRLADQALYEAKANQKNTFIIAKEDFV
ncbi:diguanylate cyclase [Anaerotignum lactatifermentans]|uniref:Diguanylate cyclase n=1 Tax=Anaerotignum lactatifermentans TaxID=160404 RepID=A0ABS2G9U4_9FIRM|nr:diguanylate cyclase [Anaerotignum lactatifermentans]MBM6829457.1 diguanylate cyclase [Anaerotignum lactatifermentans]MBM6877815.1 diguanylate cyclase [Anaerotignum lactatifermentans]MBM6951034.1 diguanylate cyclase [Anaerotignum lactatifermentans]